MKSLLVQQFAIVRSDSAETFEAELNTRVKELFAYSPKVEILDNGEYLTAKISYKAPLEAEYRPKDPTDSGITFLCQDCPYFEPMRKADGTEDGRTKYGGCKFAEFKRTYKTSKACAVLYQMIENGGIRLCLSDSE